MHISETIACLQISKIQMKYLRIEYFHFASQHFSDLINKEVMDEQINQIHSVDGKNSSANI